MPSRLTQPTVPDHEPSTRLIVRAIVSDAHPEGASPALVLDLGEVNDLTAGGLSQLVSLHKRLRTSGGHLMLCNVGEWVSPKFWSISLSLPKVSASC